MSRRTPRREFISAPARAARLLQNERQRTRHWAATVVHHAGCVSRYMNNAQRISPTCLLKFESVRQFRFPKPSPARLNPDHGLATVWWCNSEQEILS